MYNKIQQYIEELQWSNCLWLIYAFIVIVLDQVSKYLALNYLPNGTSVELIPYLKLTLAYNTGAAFSFLHYADGWQNVFFIIIAFIVSIFLFLWLLKLPKDKFWIKLALVLIIGGAFGNVIDRLHFGFVIDFLHFYIGDWSWPIFNIADSAITVGICFLVFDSLFCHNKS